MTTTRNKIFGLGDAVTKCDGEITGSRLPTALQILRSIIFHLEDGYSENRTKYEAAKIVYMKTIPFFEKGGIPMLAEQTCCQKIIKLLQENEKLRRIPKARRTTPAVIAKVEQYQNDLSKTFPLWTPNSEHIIQNPEDLKFLKSMKTDRIATIAGFDVKSFSKLKRKQERIVSAEKWHEKSARETETLFSTVRFESSSSEDETPLSSFIPQQAPKSHKRTVRTGTEAFIPHDIVKSPKLVGLATRIKMTAAQQAAFTEAFVEEAGGDASKITKSYSQADKARRQVNQEIAQECRELWMPPKFMSLHWDGKGLPTLVNKYEHEERLAVAVGDSKELKLLGIPAYKTGTDQRAGHIISNLSCGLLHSWQCSENVVNMVFDTTPTNTGQMTAACISIQQQLDRALLWSACQHHIGEIIVSHVFEDLNIESSKSPEITVFTRLRKSWNRLPHDGDQGLSHLDLQSFSVEARPLIQEWIDEVLELARTQLEYRRDDYKEMMSLCVAYLSSDTVNFSFKQPGAIHKARWMAKIIYAVKIVLLERQISELPKGTITTSSQIQKLKRFVTFISLVYCQWWFCCTVAIDAPWNSLTLYHKILKYRTVNELISNSAAKSFKRHLWYLSADMVPLALFSSKVPNAEKRRIADKLINMKPANPLVSPLDRTGSGYGKPNFPNEITLVSCLTDFIKVDSWFFFHILEIDDSFLALPVGEWSQSAAYQSALLYVGAVNVVNDVAERGVKLGTDYSRSARSEKHFQNTIQVVESNRKHIPNLRKRKSVPAETVTK